MRADPESGVIRRPWTSAEDRKLRALYAGMPTAAIAQRIGRSVSSTYQRAYKLGLEKDAAYLASPSAGRLHSGSHPNAVAYRFKPGQVPHNKGRSYQPGGRSAETQFKPGGRRGVAVKLYQPIGSERLSKDGYLQRKVNDDLPPQRRWRGVHLIRWEAINGPLPAGHALVFRDGDKANTAPENMELVKRAELMKRNSHHNRYPKEIALVIQLRGTLNRKINKRQRHEEQA